MKTLYLTLESIKWVVLIVLSKKIHTKLQNQHCFSMGGHFIHHSGNCIRFNVALSWMQCVGHAWCVHVFVSALQEPCLGREHRVVLWDQIAPSSNTVYVHFKPFSLCGPPTLYL